MSYSSFFAEQDAPYCLDGIGVVPYDLHFSGFGCSRFKIIGNLIFAAFDAYLRPFAVLHFFEVEVIKFLHFTIPNVKILHPGEERMILAPFCILLGQSKVSR